MYEYNELGRDFYWSAREDGTIWLLFYPSMCQKKHLHSAYEYVKSLIKSWLSTQGSIFTWIEAAVHKEIMFTQLPPQKNQNKTKKTVQVLQWEKWNMLEILELGQLLKMWTPPQMHNKLRSTMLSQ